MNILVIEAHPQYAGMLIAGTLYKHVQRGDHITVVALSDAEGLTNLLPMKEIGETKNRYWGLESGVMYAEPYGQLEIHEVHNKAMDYLTR